MQLESTNQQFQLSLKKKNPVTLPFSAVVSRVHPVRCRLPALHPAKEVPRSEEAEMLGARGAQRRFWVRQGPTAEAQRQIGRAGNPAED